MTVKTRFAPSPTGMLHIGGVRTALYCWLYARQHGGQFVLRIEDTDRARSTEEAIQVILDGLEWLELIADEGPYYQTHRLARYQQVLEQMLGAGQAYRCYCSKDELEAMRAGQIAAKQKPRYTGVCRERSEPRAGVEPVIRFRNPLDGEVIVDDLILGPVRFQNSELDDLIIARSDGSPTYNFSVVVDDLDMAITHVIRGNDHLNNTPRQMNMLKALGAGPPRYAHLPMILGPDGTKLSKRHGAVSVLESRREGYLPEALLNYLVRLGWAHGDQEIFTVEQMVELFDLGKVNKSAAAINPEKLLWLNQQHIMAASAERLADELDWHLCQLGVRTDSGPALVEVVRSQQERSKTMAEMAANSRFFYQAPGEYDPKAARKQLNAETRPVLAAVAERLKGIADWHAEAIHAEVHALAEAQGLGLGKVAQPVRVAVAGGPVSPPIDQTLELLGREQSLARISRALDYIDMGAG